MKAALVWTLAAIAGATPAAAQRTPAAEPGGGDCVLRIDAPSGNWTPRFKFT